MTCGLGNRRSIQLSYAGVFAQPYPGSEARSSEQCPASPPTFTSGPVRPTVPPPAVPRRLARSAQPATDFQRRSCELAGAGVDGLCGRCGRRHAGAAATCHAQKFFRRPDTRRRSRNRANAGDSRGGEARDIVSAGNEPRVAVMAVLRLFRSFTYNTSDTRRGDGTAGRVMPGVKKCTREGATTHAGARGPTGTGKTSINGPRRRAAAVGRQTHDRYAIRRRQ